MYKISFLALFIGFITISLSCTSQQRSPNIYAVLYRSHFPVFDKERDEVFNLDFTDTIYFYKDLILYNKTTTYINSVSKSETKYGVKYVFRQGEKIGIRYEPEWVSKDWMTFYADSFYRKQSFEDFPFDRIPKESDSIHLVKSKKGVFKEEYFNNNPLDETYPNKDVLHYDESLNDIPFSFSKGLDSIKKAKLVRYQGIYLPILASPYKVLRAGRMIDFYIQRLPVNNEKEIAAYFERFEKDLKGKLPEPPHSQKIQ